MELNLAKVLVKKMYKEVSLYLNTAHIYIYILKE